MREIILIIMAILAILCFYKAGTCMKDEKPYGILILGVLLFICGISLMLNFTLIGQNDTLIEKTKNKCPEYEQIENVYQLKK